MRNREKHERKFVREVKGGDIEKSLEEEPLPWCSREEAKEVIDDLTEREFEVVTDILGHLYSLNERFPTEKGQRKLQREVARFLEGKTIKKVAWMLGGQDQDPMLCLDFTDGSSLETFHFVFVPGTIAYALEKGEKTERRGRKSKRVIRKRKETPENENGGSRKKARS